MQHDRPNLKDQHHGWGTGRLFREDKRVNRWQALHEDEEVFGLVAAEYAELAILDQEFGPFTKEANPHG